jgi:glycosyltransferase involved in cell wall biosynthesis
MRILMLSQFIPPIIGGEETHVFGLSRQLALRGHEVAIASLIQPESSLEDQKDGIPIFWLYGLVQKMNFLYRETSRHHAAPYPDPKTLISLKKAIREWQPEIVHAHNWLLHSFLPIKNWSKAKLVVTLHDYSFQCATKRRMYLDQQDCSGPKLWKCCSCAAKHYGVMKGAVTVGMNNTMQGFVTRTVDMFLAVSQAVAVGNGLEEHRVPYQIIPNFVFDEPAPKYDESHPLIKQLPQSEFLLFVGDISDQKGVNILLKAYEGLNNPPPLVLIGRKCDDTPNEFPPNVYYLGTWPHEAIMGAWQRCSIAMVPSVWAEPFGLVAIEAMLSAKPVIASAVGGLTDIIDDQKTGLLVHPGDVGALRNAITKLLLDPSLRIKMGLAGNQRILRFQASEVVPQIEKVYRKLLSGEKVNEK